MANFVLSRCTTIPRDSVFPIFFPIFLVKRIDPSLHENDRNCVDKHGSVYLQIKIFQILFSSVNLRSYD